MAGSIVTKIQQKQGCFLNVRLINTKIRILFIIPNYFDNINFGLQQNNFSICCGTDAYIRNKNSALTKE